MERKCDNRTVNDRERTTMLSMILIRTKCCQIKLQNNKKNSKNVRVKKKKQKKVLPGRCILSNHGNKPSLFTAFPKSPHTHTPYTRAHKHLSVSQTSVHSRQKKRKKQERWSEGSLFLPPCFTHSISHPPSLRAEFKSLSLPLCSAKVILYPSVDV